MCVWVRCVWSHVSSVRAGTSQLVNKATFGSRASWLSVKIDCFSMLGAHEWLKKRPTLPHLVQPRARMPCDYYQVV